MKLIGVQAYVGHTQPIRDIVTMLVGQNDLADTWFLESVLSNVRFSLNHIFRLINRVPKIILIQFHVNWSVMHHPKLLETDCIPNGLPL